MIDGLDFAAPPESVADFGAVHFIGIGGAGMSAVAQLWLARGVRVTGSDARPGPAVEQLAAAGATVAIGHRAEQIGAAQTVVVSSAVRADNPELVAAMAAGLRIRHRAQALAALGKDRSVIAVAGTNGKTTTTAMVTTLLRSLGEDPGFCLGGELVRIGDHPRDKPANAALGADSAFVIEADESDGSFIAYHPEVAVITNIQPDHLDHYRDFAGVARGFSAFTGTVRPGGTVILGIDDPGAATLARQLAAAQVQPVTFGSGEADLRVYGYRLEAGGARFTAEFRGEKVAVALAVPGEHNMQNFAAAMLVGLVRGATLAQVAAAARDFAGTKRRFEFCGTVQGARVFDDYGHNPAKVAAAVATARQLAGQARLIVVFQPHLYTRTRDFANEFGRALSPADEVFVLDVYAAREDLIPGVTGELVSAAVNLAAGPAQFLADQAVLIPTLATLLKPGDVLLFVGAGDITNLAHDLVAGH